MVGALLALVLLPSVSWAMDGESYPYELETGREVGLILGAAAAYGLGFWQMRDFDPLIPEQVGLMRPSDVNSFDRPATGNWSPRADRLSDRLVTAQVLAPVLLGLTDRGGDHPLKSTLMYAETMALTTGLTFLAKNTFRRSRPFVFNQDPRIPPTLRTSMTARRSFPSGHTANAFASMVFFASVYERCNPDSGSRSLVWAGCLGTATLSGVFRVTGGWHFSTDVLAGAALGSLVGWLVPELHERGGSGGGDAGGVRLSYGFRF
jgi:hypothetical protein